MQITEFEKNIIKCIRDLHMWWEIYATTSDYSVIIKKKENVYNDWKENVYTSEEKKWYKKFL